jgi:hypothetical protein
MDPAATLLVSSAVPILCPPYPACTGVHIGGRVIPAPSIVNLFWDSDWDAHNRMSPPKAAINGMVQLLASSDYLDNANQYGVSRGSFHSAHESSTLCSTTRPSGPTDFSSLLAWITCEVQTPLTGVPAPDDNTIYAVFLPEGVTITGAISATCAKTTAFHAWSATALPDPQFLNPLAFRIQGYPYVVIPAACAVSPLGPAATMDEFSTNLSHELVEAAVDPFPTTGWIDNTNASDIVKQTNTGEIADICEKGNIYGNPGIRVRMPFGLLVDSYWSNIKGRCVPSFGCGNGVCDAGETCSSCSVDCGPCTPPPPPHRDCTSTGCSGAMVCCDCLSTPECMTAKLCDGECSR